MGGGFGHAWGINYSDVERRPLSWGVFRRILSYFLPYWPTGLAILGCIAVGSTLGLIPPLLIRAAIDEAIPSGNRSQLNLLVGGMVAIPLLAGLFGVAQNYLNAVIGQRVMYDLRTSLYEHLQRLSLRFFTQTKLGEIMTRLTSDVSGFQGIVTNTLVSIVTNIITVVSTLAVIVGMDWRLSLLAVAVLPLFIFPTRRVGRIRYRLSTITQEKLADLTSFMQQTLNISGVILVRSFAREPDEASRFRTRSREVADLTVRQSLVGRWFFMTLTFFGAAGPALIYWAGGHLVISNELTLGTVVAFVAFLGRLYGPIAGLANVHVDVMAALALCERVFHYLDQQPEIEDRPDAVPLGRAEGRIEFDHVRFEYVPGRPALEDVTFTIEPGQLTALVGPSGAGKTTVTYLLPRFYDVNAGSIRIDGFDARDLKMESLRRQIGMVTQETFLFNASIRENVAYGRPDATDEEIIAACKAANLDEFIRGLPEGYETIVGERGYRLSGGEKQRVAIARVVLKDPRILVLDEATSSLDSTSERLIQEAIERLFHGRTSLVIAHRLSTVLAADQILVLDGGQIVERGTHSELLALDGLYAVLYRQQFREPEQPTEPEPAEALGTGRWPGANGRRGALRGVSGDADSPDWESGELTPLGRRPDGY